jgi:glycosyltransferase involved in cell wall biosynthesis
MNILFFTSSKEPKDGWSVVGYNVVKNFKKFKVDIFSSENKKKISLSKTALKSEYFTILGKKVLYFDFINVLINAKKPKLIHCNVEHYAPVAMWLSKIYKVPYTVTAHGTYGVLLPVKYPIYKKAFENASKVICVSNFTKKRMIEEGIKANYEVIFNGVDKDKFKVNPNIKKENIITFVGNLKPRKGLSFLLDAMIEVNKIRDDIKVVVIGNINFESEKFKEVKKFIDDNKLNVEFTGKVTEEELINYYQKAKLNVLPSQTEPMFFEGFGLIHVEANACGTLTIGTKNSGNEDAIDEKNGYLVDYGNVKELSQKILDVFSLEKYPEIDYSKLYDWKDVSKKYEETFQKLINRDKK